MHLSPSGQPSILPNNLSEDGSQPCQSCSEQDTFEDLAIGVGLLALLASGLTVIGYHFGGPAPRLAFWRTFAPLLLLPLAVLLGIALAPGGLLGNEPVTAVRRIVFACTGLGLFVLVLVLLNAPAILLLGR